MNLNDTFRLCLQMDDTDTRQEATFVNFFVVSNGRVRKVGNTRRKVSVEIVGQVFLTT